MRRSFLTLAAAAVIGLCLAATEASACGCHKKTCTVPVAYVCPPPPPPVVCVPCPPPVVCAPVKKHGFKMFGHHKKVAYAPACAPVSYVQAGYAPPVYPTGQAYPSLQK